MFGTSIKSRVNKFIETKITEAQKRHDEKVKELRSKLDQDIEASAEQEVQSIINRF